MITDSITDLEVDLIEGISAKDSVVTINVGGKHGPESLQDSIDRYRRRLRDLSKSGERNSAKELDSTIDEIRRLSIDAMAARLPANAAEYSALCALGHRYRGRLEAMTAALQEAFSSDPSCPQAHLIAGEVAQMTADRLTGEAHVEACYQAEHHHRKVWEGGGTDGQRNMAGYRLCIDLIELDQEEEARAIRDEVLALVSSEKARQNLLSLPL